MLDQSRLIYCVEHATRMSIYYLLIYFACDDWLMPLMSNRVIGYLKAKLRLEKLATQYAVEPME